MSLERLWILSSGWPVLLCAGLVLGFITVWSKKQRTHLAWFLPVLLLASVAFVLLTGEADSVLILVPEQLGIGVVALFPGVLLSFLAAWCVLELRTRNWLLVAAPALVCVASAPLAGYVASVAVCELISDCQ